jgi:hypothetical protein
VATVVLTARTSSAVISPPSNESYWTFEMDFDEFTPSARWPVADENTVPVVKMGEASTDARLFSR